MLLLERLLYLFMIWLLFSSAIVGTWIIVVEIARWVKRRRDR